MISLLLAGDAAVLGGAEGASGTGGRGDAGAGPVTTLAAGSRSPSKVGKATQS